MKILLKVAYFWWCFWEIREARENLSDEFTTAAISVQEFYKSPSVFIVYDRHYYVFEKESTLLSLVRSYSRRNRMSQAISYDELARASNGRRENALYALLIRDRENLEHAINVTRGSDISAHPWLLVSESADFDCDRPGLDFFRLEMNTKMAALCRGNAIVKSYYGVFDNQTEVVDLAEWTPERRLEFKDHGTLAKARANMKGIILEVANTTLDVTLNANLFCTDVIEELKTLCNFQTEQGPQDDWLGFYDKKTGKWSGLMKLVSEKTADIGGTLFTMSKTRMQVVDFATPLLSGQCHLYAKLPNYSEVRWDAYFQVFSNDVIIAEYSPILIFSTVLCFMTRRRSMCTFFENLINVWGIYTQQGVSEASSRSSIRLMYLSALFWSFVLHSIYSACFISYVTVLSPKLPFDSYEQFRRDNNYQVAVIKGSKYYNQIMGSNDSLLSPLKSRMKKSCFLPRNSYRGFLQACEENTAFYVTEEQYAGMKNYLPCQLGSVKMERVEYSSFVLTKNSPYTKTMSYFIMRLKDFGILKRLKDKYFHRLTELPRPQSDAITLEEIFPILTVWVMGILTALILLILEIVVFRWPVTFSASKRKCFLRRRSSIKSAIAKKKTNARW